MKFEVWLVQLDFPVFLNVCEYLWIVIISKVHVISCAWCMLEVFGVLHCFRGLDLVISVFRKTSAVN